MDFEKEDEDSPAPDGGGGGGAELLVNDMEDEVDVVEGGSG